MLDRKNLPRLRRILVRSFSEGDLRDLSFELDVDYESLQGTSKADKARELIAYLERRGRICDLIEVGQQLRPDVAWPETNVLQQGIEEEYRRFDQITELKGGSHTTRVHRDHPAERITGKGCVAATTDAVVTAGERGIAVGRDTYGPVVIASEGASVTITASSQEQPEAPADMGPSTASSSLEKRVLCVLWQAQSTEDAGLAEKEIQEQTGIAVRSLRLCLSRLRQAGDVERIDLPRLMDGCTFWRVTYQGAKKIRPVRTNPDVGLE